MRVLAATAAVLMLAACTGSTSVAQPSAASSITTATVAAPTTTATVAAPTTIAASTTVPGPPPTASANPTVDAGAEPSAVLAAFGVESIQTLADLQAASWESYDEFCTEVAKYLPEDPEIVAFHELLGQDGTLYDSSYIACLVHVQNPVQPLEITEQDLHPRSSERAQGATFQLYDLTWTDPELVLIKRLFVQANSRETPSQFFVYSTIHRGGFASSYSSEVVQARIFDTHAFPDFGSNCGPRSMSGPSFFDDEECTLLGIEVHGVPVYTQDGTYGLEYTMTLGSSRIVVQRSRSEGEAVAILESAVASSVDDIVWLFKVG